VASLRICGGLYPLPLTSSWRAQGEFYSLKIHEI
jgi:hypothetical protein